MNKLQISLLTLALAATTNIKAQTQVTNFTPGIVAEGINYALPKTGLQLEVVSTTTTFTPGELSRYAERYLHIANVRHTASTQSVISDMVLTTISMPDTTKYFTIKLKKKTIAPFVQLTPEGILLSINDNNPVTESTTVAVPKSTSNRVSSRNYMSNEMLSAGTSAKLAELVAAEIYDIRESRTLIMKGQVDTMPKDGPSLQIVLDELNRQETALTQLFIGYEETKSEKKTFIYFPEGDVEKHVLFRHSDKLGFVDNDDLAGTPYYISVKDKHTVPTTNNVDKDAYDIGGVAYNIPSMADITIYSVDRKYISKQIPFGQFGPIDILSSTLFNKEATTKVQFNPLTGGLKSISN